MRVRRFALKTSKALGPQKTGLLAALQDLGRLAGRRIVGSVLGLVEKQGQFLS